MKFSILGAALLAMSTNQLTFAAPAATTTATATVSSSYLPQQSPIFRSMTPATGVVTSYNKGPYNMTDYLPVYTLKGYPDPGKVPDPIHPEVVAAAAKIDWSLVPKAPVRIQDKASNFHPKTDGSKDLYCWWSDTNCLKPKINVPEDFHSCPRKGNWGLSYDDEPFNLWTGKIAALENPYAEPYLYNFLAKTNNQKANLFYIGGNVVTYPEAAKRAFNDGHYICVHTWSHPAMTTMTNEQAVAEFYWTLKVIKETTGVTPKCWRPPQGDVDDRIRSIAWQMGMHTVMWDWDTNDWDMLAPGGGNLPPSTVDGYFEGWIADEKSGNQTDGHIVLEHVGGAASASASATHKTMMSSTTATMKKSSTATATTAKSR